jgi:hypothetical protein
MVVDKVIDELIKLNLAKSILEKVFLEVGPYNTGTISERTLDEIREFFNFDDSE